MLSLPPAARDEALAAVNAALRGAGLIRAWRGETYPVFAPATAEVLARIERASAHLWGTPTLGAHATGWVAGDDGRPARLWIAERAAGKATDPGALDNLVGGGVPAGQSPWQTLLREGWEEAGLDAATMRGARAGRVITIAREVAAFHDLPLADALAAAAGEAMTVDASLVTLDFALRHRLLAGDTTALAALEAAAAPLWLAQPAIASGAPGRP